MTDGRTHWEGCWREYGHMDCAVAQVERLEGEVGRLRDALRDEIDAWPALNTDHPSYTLAYSVSSIQEKDGE